MKSQPVEILESAEPDLRYARNFYASWQSDGAAAFMGKFRDTAAWIDWNPELFPKKFSVFRRAIIRKTYFAIYYVIQPSKTVITAVLDMRQSPKHIRSAVKQRWRKR